MSNASQHLPDDIGRTFREIERRLRALETAPRATNTSILDGRLAVLDNERRDVVRVGKQFNGKHGLGIIHPETGNYTMFVDQDGIGAPFTVTPFRFVQAPIADNGAMTVTSGSWVDVAETELQLLHQDSVRVRVPAVPAALSAGEVRLAIVLGANTVARAVTGSGSSYDFRWRTESGAGLAPGTGPVPLRIQARVTAGASISVWLPSSGAVWYGSQFLYPPSTDTGV